MKIPGSGVHAYMSQDTLEHPPDETESPRNTLNDKK